MLVTDKNGQEWETGVIFDSHSGWHNEFRLYSLAREHGMPEPEYWPNADDVISQYDNGEGIPDSDHDIVSEIVQDSEDWLNGILPDGFAFGWFDGDFVLWSITDWDID